MTDDHVCEPIYCHICEARFMQQQEECDHKWERVGSNPTWGDLYECPKCGGQTP